MGVRGDALHLSSGFELRGIVARGGMGEVYRATDQRSGGDVAVKLLARGACDDPVRFEHEASVLSSLNDPRIVRYIAHGVTPDGRPYLVTEWLDGEDLSARLRRGRMSVREAVDTAREVAGALAVLHRSGIVHRDVKPSNVFIARSSARPAKPDAERIKLLDFGVAFSAARTRVTETGALIGTAGYMAPEQVRAEGVVDARADVFALGCLLFECLAGAPAFPGDHCVSIFTRILFGPTPRLEDHGVSVPEALAALVEQMLSRTPADRPAAGCAAWSALSALHLDDRDPVSSTTLTPRRRTVTNREPRMVAVVLLEPGDEGAPSGAELDRLEREASLRRGRVEHLADGSCMATLSAEVRDAADLAVRAARWALHIARGARGCHVALTLGLGEHGREDGLRSVSEQAGPLLASASSQRAGLGRGLVRVDATTASLLAPRFVVDETYGAFYVVEERGIGAARPFRGAPPPFVGRERELRTLLGLFEAACVERTGAQIGLVSGPAGEASRAS